jgi:hypothetical protein
LPNHPGIEAQTSVKLLTGEMKAWGPESNLFHQGGAKESEDAAVAAATKAGPCGENVVDLMDVLRQSLG